MTTANTRATIGCSPPGTERLHIFVGLMEKRSVPDGEYSGPNKPDNQLENDMPRYRIIYEQTDRRVMIIEAESESAARQAWIDNDFDHDDYLDTLEQGRIQSVDEVR